MNNKEIPDIVVSRLPRYLRALLKLREKASAVSSQELGRYLGLSAAQIRKDFSQFGEFGKQGTGYNIDFLISQIRSILNIDKNWQMILVGVGHIGQAILNYSGFSANGFRIVAAVDIKEETIGQTINGTTIRDYREAEEIIRQNEIKIAMLTVPADEAQKVADELVRYGIKAFLTYAPTVLNLPTDVQVEYIDPIISLQHITYYL